MQTQPLVSVVLPAHNASQTIIRALHSVATQTYPNLEIIVVDDASTDGTAALVSGWNEAPVRLERLTTQSGAAAARNHGLKLARGEYVAFLDADDEWLPEKTTMQVSVLNWDPTISFVTCESWLVGADGTIKGTVNSGRTRPVGAKAWKTLLRHPSVATPCVMVRRDQALALGGFDASLPIAEDQDFWIRLALAGSVAHLPQELVRVHDRPGSLSKRESRNTAAITLPIILRHLAQNRDRLSAQERREIRGIRYAALGRNAYLGGSAGEGAVLLSKAILLGHQPLQNLAYLIFSSPPARLAKRLIRGPSALQS